MYFANRIIDFYRKHAYFLLLLSWLNIGKLNNCNINETSFMKILNNLIQLRVNLKQYILYEYLHHI